MIRPPRVKRNWIKASIRQARLRSWKIVQELEPYAVTGEKADLLQFARDILARTEGIL